MQKVIAALKSYKIDEKDIQTSHFSVRPEYEKQDTRKTQKRPQRIVGYRVTNSVSVTVRELSRFGEILDELVVLGANRINQISFDVSNPEKYIDQAREKAMSKAIAKAELYARSAGAKLGKVLSIREGHSSQPMRKRFDGARFLQAEAASAVPIAAGSQDLSVRLSVSWGISGLKPLDFFLDVYIYSFVPFRT